MGPLTQSKREGYTVEDMRIRNLKRHLHLLEDPRRELQSRGGRKDLYIDPNESWGNGHKRGIQGRQDGQSVVSCRNDF